LSKFWISLAIGIFCILAWLGGRQEAAASNGWPSVPGVVTAMEISESRSNDGTRTTHAKVTYTYSVNGKSYQGDRVKVESMTDPSEAERYPKGTPVKVFYDPAHPEAAVLEQGGAGLLFWGIVGFSCLIYSAWVLFQRFSSRRKSPVAAVP